MKKGFTLIEIVIVISLISILSVSLAPKVLETINKSKVSKVANRLSNLRTELSVYHGEGGQKIETLDEFKEIINPESETLSSRGLEKSYEVYSERTNEGGWIYDLAEEKVYANLPNGNYTGNVYKEIWGEELIAVNEVLSKDYVSNGSFEDIGSKKVKTWKLISDTEISGWSSSTGEIEVWKDGFLGVDAPGGDYFVELNGRRPGTLYQEVESIPGTKLQWKVSHKGRNGVDKASISIGSGADEVVLEVLVTDKNEWVHYTGVYEVPEGQTTTRFNINSVETYRNRSSVGNLLDGFSIEEVK